MEYVDVGVMLPGAINFNDHNVNPTVKAHVKTHDEVVVAYVKLVSARKLYIECVCALLGRHLGLPIPKPMIVRVSSEDFPDIPAGQYGLAFGSQDAGYPSFRRYVNNHEAYEKLKEFTKTIDVGLFDEWVANWDRNVGNILYDGGKRFFFIDHENAIDPKLGHEDPAEKNQLVDCIYAVKSEFEKYKLNRVIQTEVIPQYVDLPMAVISDKTHAGSYLEEADILSVINFLEMRVNSLGRLFSKRLKLAQQDMAI